eukprot:15436793-Alexandrium_andersonii.AAC.1
MGPAGTAASSVWNAGPCSSLANVLFGYAAGVTHAGFGGAGNGTEYGGDRTDRTEYLPAQSRHMQHRFRSSERELRRAKNDLKIPPQEIPSG